MGSDSRRLHHKNENSIRKGAVFVFIAVAIRIEPRVCEANSDFAPHKLSPFATLGAKLGSKPILNEVKNLFLEPSPPPTITLAVGKCIKQPDKHNRLLIWLLIYMVLFDESEPVNIRARSGIRHKHNFVYSAILLIQGDTIDHVFALDIAIHTCPVEILFRPVADLNCNSR